MSTTGSGYTPVTWHVMLTWCCAGLLLVRFIHCAGAGEPEGRRSSEVVQVAGRRKFDKTMPD